MISIDAGIIISINPLFCNAYFSIRDNLDPDSNVSEVSDSQKRKHFSSMTSTEAGITILSNFVPQNACFLSSDNLDPHSNLTDERDPH
jgi:hypothetical protein